MSVNSQIETPRATAYRETVEEFHEYLCNLISQNYNNGGESHEERATRGSSGFNSTYHNGYSSSSK